MEKSPFGIFYHNEERKNTFCFSEKRKKKTM